MADAQIERFLELQAEAQRQRMNFIKTEAELGITFADLGQTELTMDNIPHAKRARVHAQAAYDTIIRELSRAEGITDDERQWLDLKLRELAGKIGVLPE
ncbi:MAG: hypothetical protein M3Z85_08535 [Acidobacteriota bacterium]|nr:hypothetical protein [Acidobacteriota bacterium]